MARITVEDCLEKIDSQYDLVLLAKERTSQLNAGGPSLVSQDNDKNTVISLREIAEEKEQSKSQEDIYPEESIYNKFTSNKDTALFPAWHSASWKDKLKLLDIILNEMQNSLKRGERVELRDVFTLETRVQKARMSRNPKTNEKIETPEKKSIHFKMSKEWFKKLNKSE